MAITALVLGIIGILTACVCVGPLFGLAALILGIMALRRVALDPGRFGGKAQAIGGIATGVAAVALGLLWIGGMTMAWPSMKVAAQMALLDDALTEYESGNYAYPPDLHVLDSEGFLVDLGPIGDALEGTYYVTDVGADDPSGWLLAYKPFTILGRLMYGVVVLDEGADVWDASQFDRTLADFKAAYEADRGTPPVILDPIR